MNHGEPVTGPTPLLTVAASDLIARIEAESTAASILAFDADGTLWSGDIGMDVFQALLDQRKLRREAAAALSHEAAEFALACYDEPNDQARELFRAFAEGSYPEDRAFAMMAWALAGYPETEVRRLVASLVAAAKLPSRLLPESVHLVRWATARAIPVAVVSASPTLVVEAAIADAGLTATRVFGMSAATRDGLVLPALAAIPTYGAGKAETLRRAYGDTRVTAAFGDSTFDLPMLRMARLPVAVRPKPELVARRDECPGLLELARLPSAGDVMP